MFIREEIMYYKIKNPKIKQIFSEILGRMDLVDVRGQSVEQLFMIRMGLKQIIESLEEIQEAAD
jgi:hypothetical protein